MKPLEALAGEFQHEAAATRKVLERLPEESYGWKPHEKSWSAAGLASHIVNIPSWIGPTLDQAELVLDPATYKPWIAASRAELLAKFDENVAAGLAAFGKYGDDVFSHMIHHRGQLSVYLRMLNVPVPAIYGPSADEPWE
jgi:uncharacterized damage-inducible protein DinB